MFENRKKILLLASAVVRQYLSCSFINIYSFYAFRHTQMCLNKNDGIYAPKVRCKKDLLSCFSEILLVVYCSTSYQQK